MFQHAFSKISSYYKQAASHSRRRQWCRISYSSNPHCGTNKFQFIDIVCSFIRMVVCLAAVDVLLRQCIPETAHFFFVSSNLRVEYYLSHKIRMYIYIYIYIYRRGSLARLRRIIHEVLLRFQERTAQETWIE